MLTPLDHLLIVLEFALTDVLIAYVFVAHLGPRLNAKRVEAAIDAAVTKLKTRNKGHELVEAREEGRITKEQNAAELEVMLAEHVAPGAAALFRMVMPDAYRFAVKNGAASVEPLLPKLKKLWEKHEAKQEATAPWMQR